MKKLLLCLSMLVPAALYAQQIIDIGIYNNPVNSDKLEVRIRPTQTISNSSYTAGVFTVRFLSSYGVTLTAPAALNNPLFRYAIANQGTDGTYNYYSLSFVQPFTVNWIAGTEYPIAILQINPGCGSGDGIFEIINNAWTAANNGNVYQELNGTEAQNIIYKANATAPLGMGMSDNIPPTVICPSNKSASTDFNRCYYTHSGTLWDAVGNDNCPGFVIRYVLSGATIDTVYTLDDVVFNKGITTLDVTVTDGAGLTAMCSFNVTIEDTQPPILSAPPSDTVLANVSNCSAIGINFGTPVFADNCPGAQIMNNAPQTFPKGTTIVTWTVTDAAGLTAVSTQIITVQSSLSANNLSLSTHTVCYLDTAKISFGISGGIGPYTVVYSTNGMLDTVTAYTSNKLLPVSPSISTRYTLVSVADSIGCSILPLNLTDSITVNPLPSLSSLTPSLPQICLGTPDFFTANGLLPNDSMVFQYTLTPGGLFSEVALSTAAGTFAFSPATNIPGVYGMSIQSITANGCKANFTTGNSGSYIVHPLPTISSINPSAEIVCAGTAVNITANGLLPDVSATFQFSINGIPGTETVLTNSTGTATLLSAFYPEGNYTIIVTSVSVAGCSIACNLSATFTVDPFQPMCGFTIAGRIATETNKGVEEVNVPISGFSNGNPFAYLDVTDTSGVYSFINTIPLAADYFIKPVKDDNPINGLTTYDLVLISKHILGTAPLDSPYKIIAADANKSNSVTTFDIVEFRKLILGIYQKMPNNTSWRFVDKDYVFPSPNNPFNPVFPESISRSNLQLNTIAEDFVAVKVGDVNGSVILGLNAPTEDRLKRETLFINLEVTNASRSLNNIKAGEVFSVAFKPTELVAGFQFTLEYSELELLDIHPENGMSLDNFGIFPNAITTSFVSNTPAQTGAFSVTFRAKSAKPLAEILYISSKITPAEAYRFSNNLEILDLKAHFDGAIDQNRRFELYQNQPNPFTGTTQFPFYLPETETLRFSITDALGSIIYTVTGTYESGHNTFTLPENLALVSGLYYFKVESSNASAIKKMLKV